MPEITSSKFLVQAEGRPCWHKPDRTKRCILCDEVKALGEFYAYEYTTRQGKRSTRYESRCFECARERRRRSYAKDRPRQLVILRRYRERTRDERAAYNRRRQELVEVKALKAYHQRLRKARMRSRSGDNAAIRALYAEAMRIEAVVANCPIFDLPELGKKMHVDHVVPLSRGGKHEIGNLQILPAGLNMRKGTSCPR